MRPITLRNKTFEGRPVEGIEIATNPTARDGRPVFLQMGVHHAREWPSGEHAMEWAYELITGARYARWLAVVPVLAFMLLAGAPVFQRSALRVLPHGHLQWRLEQYLRDVNSALAGYVRAQTAAGLIVGLTCVAGFALLGIGSAVSFGVLAGILELVPAIGPLTFVVRSRVAS